jgi:hypothetical protein
VNIVNFYGLDNESMALCEAAVAEAPQLTDAPDRRDLNPSGARVSRTRPHAGHVPAR